LATQKKDAKDRSGKISQVKVADMKPRKDAKGGRFHATSNNRRLLQH
jgi:hypothetical protein